MRYIPITVEERQRMLQEMGVDRIDDLFRTIPDKLRMRTPLQIPEARAESALLEYFKALSRENASAEEYEYFLGAGAYNHFVPGVIDSLISRGEFYTTYTPYQPEISQGTLQAIFEFQTLICQLSGMEVANASLYDGSSSLAEAVLMALRITGRHKVLLPTTVHPEYARVLKTYVSNLGIHLEPVQVSPSGGVKQEQLEAQLNEDCAAVVLQSPNFFGVIEEVEEIAHLSQKKGALCIVVVTEAISLGLVEASWRAGSGHRSGRGTISGNILEFRGALSWFFHYPRPIQTSDARPTSGSNSGHSGTKGLRVDTVYPGSSTSVVTKRLPNICTNQGLCALVCAIFFVYFGKARHSGNRRTKLKEGLPPEASNQQLPGLFGAYF